MNKLTSAAVITATTLILVPLITSPAVADFAERTMDVLSPQSHASPFEEEPDTAWNRSTLTLPLSEGHHVESVELAKGVKTNTVVLQRYDDYTDAWEDVSSATVGSLGKNGAEVVFPKPEEPGTIVYRFRAPATETPVESDSSKSFTVRYSE